MFEETVKAVLLALETGHEFGFDPSGGVAIHPRGSTLKTVRVKNAHEINCYVVGYNLGQRSHALNSNSVVEGPFREISQ